MTTHPGAGRRALLVCWNWPTHLYAMAPWADALLSEGHQVRVACPPGLVPVARRLGLEAVAVGPDRDTLPDFQRMVVREAAPPGAALPPGRTPRALSLFAELADAMGPDLLRFAEEWTPQLVLSDPTAFAGPVVAAAVGARGVRCLYGPDLVSRFRELLPQLVEPLRRRLGVPAPVDPLGGLTLDPAPDCLRLPGTGGPGGVLRARWLPDAGLPDVPARLPERTAPRVCVTWGHTMAALGPELFLTGRISAELAAAGLEVVAAVTADQLPLLGPVPQGVRVVVDTPLRRLLPRCDLLVSQGGAGTVLAGLAAGVPQLAVGQLPDHLGIARSLESGGAGRALAGPDARPGAVRAAVRELLADPGIAAAARRAGQELLGLPEPAGLLDRLFTASGPRADSSSNRSPEPAATVWIDPASDEETEGRHARAAHGVGLAPALLPDGSARLGASQRRP